MKRIQLCALTLLLLCACTQNQKTGAKTAVVKSKGSDSLHKEAQQKQTKAETVQTNTTKAIVPEVSVQDVLKDFNSFWQYYSANIQLYQDFTALNSAAKVISKEAFLKQMQSGLYFPLQVDSKDGAISYQLQKIPAKADKFIADYMRQFSTEELAYYRMEGKPLPAFSFTDVNGKLYTSKNTIGKVLVLKCWFIGCVACVKEMPALNELVSKYKDNKDVLFVSLAMDDKKALKQFLTKTRFDYATVPGQTKYMAKDLKVAAYPTHFLIDKKGILVRVLPNNIQVADFLAKEVAKKS